MAASFRKETRSFITSRVREQTTDEDEWYVSPLFLSDFTLAGTNTSVTTINSGDSVTGNTKVSFVTLADVAIIRGNFLYKVDGTRFSILSPGVYHVQFNARFRGGTRTVTRAGLVPTDPPRNRFANFFSHGYARNQGTSNAAHAYIHAIVTVPRSGLDLSCVFESISTSNANFVANESSFCVTRVGAIA